MIESTDRQPKRISHSMLEAYLQCGKKYELAHTKNLEPDRDSEPLMRGTIGHYILEGFFNAIKDGMSHKDAFQAAGNRAMQKYLSDPLFPEALALCGKWVVGNADTIKRWKVIETEKTEFLPIPGLEDMNGNQIEFPFTIDLYIQDMLSGKYYIVDFKFLYDFYDDDLVALLPQLPKYAGAKRALGHRVDDAYYAMIRTRKLSADAEDEKRWRTTRLMLTDKRIVEAMQQQVTGMEEMVKRPKLPLRTVNKMNCSNCSFREICIAEASQEKTDIIIKHGFRENSYGYEDVN